MNNQNMNWFDTPKQQIIFAMQQQLLESKDYDSANEPTDGDSIHTVSYDSRFSQDDWHSSDAGFIASEEEDDDILCDIHEEYTPSPPPKKRRRIMSSLNKPSLLERVNKAKSKKMNKIKKKKKNRKNKSSKINKIHKKKNQKIDMNK